MYRRVLDEDIKGNTIIVPLVVEFFRERGVNILGLDDMPGIAISPPKGPISDAGTKLRWIKEQVVPTIRKLAEMGYAEELMELIAEAIAAARNEQA